MKSTHILGIRLPSTFVGTVIGTLVLVAPAFSQSYTTFDIGTLGGKATYATAINASGQVTGNSVTVDGPYHAFVTQANGLDMTDLGTLPGGDHSYGFDINSSGQVTGKSGWASSLGVIYPHAFIADINGGVRAVTESHWSEGLGINNAGQVVGYIGDTGHTGSDAFVTAPNGLNASQIGGLHSDGDRATDINSSGQVVGSAHLSSGLYEHAYITSANHVFASDLGTLGGYRSFATGVNDSGQVVGYSDINRTLISPIHAFITDIDSNMTDLGTLGGQGSYAADINSQGQVVGWAETAIGNRKHAFVTGPDGEGMTDLNSLVELENGIFLADAMGINDRGQIIANASDGRAYLLSPVPEPQAYAMLLAGLGLMGFMARRKKKAA
ncbi:MAG: DUF3466 family protein [Nitrosospira sp.]|nr:DUF3466 family protein [Nitrosospira sp.]